MAHPADAPGRHTGHQRERRDIGGHDRASGDEGVLADDMTADDRGVGSDRRAALDQRRAEFVLALDAGPRIVDVGEYRGGAAEHPVFEGDTLVDRDIVLDLAAVADRHVGTSHDILAERAIPADPGTRQNMNEMPNAGAGTDLARLVEISRFVHLHARKRSRLWSRRRDRCLSFLEGVARPREHPQHP